MALCACPSLSPWVKILTPHGDFDARQGSRGGARADITGISKRKEARGAALFRESVRVVSPWAYLADEDVAGDSRRADEDDSAIVEVCGGTTRLCWDIASDLSRGRVGVARLHDFVLLDVNRGVYNRLDKLLADRMASRSGSPARPPGEEGHQHVAARRVHRAFRAGAADKNLALSRRSPTRTSGLWLSSVLFERLNLMSC